MPKAGWCSRRPSLGVEAEPDAIVDIATPTGAAGALGLKMAACWATTSPS
jgi:leucyl aminopeptidase